MASTSADTCLNFTSEFTILYSPDFPTIKINQIIHIINNQ
jgi:hypothetical protein